VGEERTLTTAGAGVGIRPKPSLQDPTVGDRKALISNGGAQSLDPRKIARRLPVGQASLCGGGAVSPDCRADRATVVYNCRSL
jgi:hypothetical protein